MRYLNLSIFLVLLSVYIVQSSHVKFSTNFLEVFFSQDSIKLFNIAKKFGLSDEILISKKGFSDTSLDELYEIAQSVKKLPNISRVEIGLSLTSPMKEYIKNNYYLLSDFNSSEIPQREILERLQNIYNNIYDGAIYEPINSYDPLGLFKIEPVSNSKYLKLEDYGYVLRAKTTIDTADATQAREVYNDINLVLDRYEETIVFAPFFYLVENSKYIRDDAQMIMLVSTLLLLVLYFFILKNHKLFFNAILAIASSILSAILLSSLVFQSISILALVFGISITTISIDYMFHYYFHNSFSKKKPIFVKRVFFGFVTSFGVFVIFNFIEIELFAQLAFFSAVSLAVAYSLFSFTFVYLKINPPLIRETNKNTKSFKPLYIVIVSLMMLAYSYNNLEFDNNLRNLDYQNSKLLDLSQKFKKGMQTDRYETIIIDAKSRESVLLKYEELLKTYPTMLGIGKFVYSDKRCQEKLSIIKEYDFVRVKKYLDIYSKKVGFNNVFDDTYNGMNKLTCDMHVIDEMKFKIIKDEDIYYTMALIEKEDEFEDIDGARVVDLAKTLSQDTKAMKDILVKYMIISMIFIMVILFFISGFELLYPLAYLLFPISTVLFYITLFSEINIMHMFALVILLAIGIDYGIYMHKTSTLAQTRTAIRYALLSTFSGFGVLIFSNTMALHSIGLVVTIGIASIFILLYSRDVLQYGYKENR
ncbi:MAG: hypothetical protein U9N33_11510 [Campylobacterota bacterium]|nr:hypothetical protein [Campylobacterota bacterium]